MTERFLAPTPFQPSHPPVLAIYCSDGRFTRPVEELLRQLGHDRLDTLTMPGGPALLNLHSALYSNVDAMTRAASFLILGHAIAEVVLLAHEGCGYYRERHPNLTPDEVARRQIDDLRAGAGALRKAHPELRIALYHARVHQGRVVFHRVSR